MSNDKEEMSQLRSIGAYYAEQITSTQHDPRQLTTCMTEVEKEAMREYYENAMIPWDLANANVNTFHQYIPKIDAWGKVKEQFDSVISEIEKNLPGIDANQNTVSSPTEEDIVIRVENKNYTFKPSQTITVGRISLTDIPLKDISNGTSRLHAVIKRFGEQLVIMDVGSYSGIKLLERSNEEAPCERSKPGDRRPLIIGAKEHAIFMLGPSVKMIINPKECILMLSLQCNGIRDFKGQCGHFICCTQCANQWANQNQLLCPMCRAPFYGPNAASNTDQLKTMCK